MAQSPYDRWLHYFERGVLQYYRMESHRFTLEEDDLGGMLEAKDSPYFDVRFGFRLLADGSRCVAALDIDLARLPDTETRRWSGYAIKNPMFKPDDPAFKRWTERNFEISYEAEDGPLIQIKDLIRLVNALTRQTLGEPLWRSDWNPRIHYPNAENSDAYADAHLEIYRVLIDSLNRAAILQIANYLSVELANPNWTLNSLKALLPCELHTTIHSPLKKVYDERQKKHGVPTCGVQSLAAFDTFLSDAKELVAALNALNIWLQERLESDAATCLRREEIMSSMRFPAIVSPAEPSQKYNQLANIKEKTVAHLDFGKVESHPEVHESEALVLHFTDGSALSIQVGSNAGNIAVQHDTLVPSDFRTDLMVFWAPGVLPLSERGRLETDMPDRDSEHQQKMATNDGEH